MFRVYRKMSRPIVPALAIAFGMNALIASYVTYREQIAYAKLKMKLLAEDQASRQQPVPELEGF